MRNYICSRLKAETGERMQENIRFANDCMKTADTIFGERNQSVAPHAILSEYLDDSNSEERALALSVGQALLEYCERLIVCIQDDGVISDGMRAEISFAHCTGIPVFYLLRASGYDEKGYIHMDLPDGAVRVYAADMARISSGNGIIYALCPEKEFEEAMMQCRT